MKKLLISLILLLSFSGVSYAASLYGEYQGFPIAKLLFNNQEVESNDVPPINVNGSIMVPLSTLQSMGLSVAWDNVTKTVSVSDGKTSATPDKPNKMVKTQAEIQALDKAVAYIEELDSNGNVEEIGSGVVVNSKGLLLSAAHVADINGVLCNLRVTVNGQTYLIKAGDNVFYDAKKDIFAAYLPGKDFDYIPMNTELPKFKDGVYVIGNPQGKRNILTDGIADGVYDRGIGTTAFVEGGNSGGAMLNKYGELIGIVTDDILGAFAKPIWMFQEAYTNSFN